MFVPVKMDGKTYNIPLSLFYTESLQFNKEFCLSSSSCAVALWKIAWGSGISTLSPTVNYKIGWENGVLNDESNMRAVTDGIYWIFKGFIIHDQPLHVTFSDNAVWVRNASCTLYLACIDLSALPNMLI